MFSESIYYYIPNLGSGGRGSQILVFFFFKQELFNVKADQSQGRHTGEEKTPLFGCSPGSPGVSSGPARSCWTTPVATTPGPSSRLPPVPKYLGQAGSEENTFKEFPHSSQELIHIRPLEHIDLRRRCWVAGGVPAREASQCCYCPLHRGQQVGSD